MIFVTVGSTYFDELIEEVDNLASGRFFDQEVVCQIGSGRYLPRACRYFRSAPDIETYLDECNLLITHGGMTVLEAIWRHKAVIAVANSNIHGNHQVPFLKKLATTCGLIWTDDPKQLKNFIPLATTTRVHFSEPHLGDYLMTLI